MEREPARQEHDLDRHHRHAAPGDLAVERQQDAGEDVALRGAAARQDRLAGAAHVRRVGRVADHLQREIGLDAGAHVERRRRGTAASRRARPGCGADRRRSSPRAPGRPARRGNGGSSTYSAGMVASASSSKHQWPSRARAARQRPRRGRHARSSASDWPSRRAQPSSLVAASRIIQPTGTPHAAACARAAPRSACRFEIRRRRGIARADRALDGGRQAGRGPVAGQDEIVVIASAPAGAAPPLRASPRRSRAAP